MSDMATRRAGNIDIVSRNGICGWYISSENAGPAKLRVYADGALFSEFVANGKRPDVSAAGFGEEACGFQVELSRLAGAARTVEIVDAADDACVWRIDLDRHEVLNNLLPGGLSAEAAPSTELKTQLKEEAGLKILFDVSDLVYYIGHHDNLTGIQRVQSSVIQAMIKDGVLPQANVGFIAFDSTLGKFQRIDERSFLSLLADMSRPVADRTVTFDQMKARTGHLFPRGDLKLSTRTGRNTVISLLGAAWVIPDYVNVILSLKRRYGVRFVPTIHDLIPIYAKETCDQGTAEVFKVFLDQILRHVDVALCVSDNTARDLSRYCAENDIEAPPMHVTRNGSSLEEFFPVDDEDDGAAESIAYLTRDPYVLFVSTIEGRKNHLYAFQIWEKLLKAGIDMPRLVCVGRLGWRSEAFLQSLLRTDNLNGHIQIVEDISDAELKTLYKHSLFSVYPSQYEGWGLPVGESLYYGKPCVLTSSSSLPEVAGDLGIYIPSDDVDGAAHVIRELIENPDHLAKITESIEKNFASIKWSEVAAAVVAGCYDALSRPATNLSPAWQLGREYTFRQLRVEQSGRMGQQMLEGLIEANKQVLLNGFLSQKDKILGLESRDERWFSPEPWGCWSKGLHAGLNVAIDFAELKHAENVCVFAAFQVPGQYLPCSVGLKVERQVIPGKYSVREASSIQRWVVPTKLLRSRSKLLTGSVGEISLELQLFDVSPSARNALQAVDSRNLGIGLKSLLITPDNDYVARINIAEKLLFR